MTVAPTIPDLYAKLDAWLEENEPIKLHKPGGKGHNQKRHGMRSGRTGIFADSTGTFSDSDRTLKTAANRISAIGNTVKSNDGSARWFESTRNKERRVSLDGGGNNAVHITRKFGDKGGWAVSTGEFSKRRKFGEFADKKEAIDWVNKSAKASSHTVTRVKVHPTATQLRTNKAGEYRVGDAVRTNDIQLASEHPFPLWRELREEEQHVALAQIVGRLDQGTATLQRIIRRAREEWVEELDEKVRKAVAGGPIAISEVTIDPASVRRLARQLAKEMESLFQFGQDQMQNELDSMQDSMAMRDDDPNVREIRELFLARARIMSIAISQAIERTAQSYAENMWRTLGPDGITVAEIDIMTGEMLKIGNQQARRAALNNVSESYSMGRHYKAMRNIDKIGFALYSAVLDGKTCRPCANADGKRVRVDTAQYYKFLPPHRNCAGRGACRCMYIYVLKTESLLNDEEGIKLHKPGGKGHNQKLHGNRAKVGSFMDVAGQTEEELAAFTQFTPGFVEGPTKSQQKNIEDNWTSRPYDSIQAMRQRYGEGKPNFEDRQLVNDIKTTSTFNGPVYRGMSFDNKDNRTAFEGIKKDYAVGKEVDMKGINSFTSSRREAYSFADLTRTGGKIRDEETGSFTWKPTPSTDSVVIRVNSRSMRDIRNYSTYNEKEVVSLPGTRFRVTGTRTINATDAETKSGRQNVVAGRNVTKKSQVLVVEMEEIG
jgi:hypothetical protein